MNNYENMRKDLNDSLIIICKVFFSDNMIIPRLILIAIFACLYFIYSSISWIFKPLIK